MARVVVDLATTRPPTLGAGRLICVDGPGGSGKSTLADAIEALTPAAVVGMDDLYDGWAGLRHVADQLGPLLEPLARGDAGGYHRYDWQHHRYAEWVQVSPVPLLVLEGVGSGAAQFDHLRTVLVWVEAGRSLRLQRGLARDGAGMRDQWEAWMADEDRLFATQRTRDRADVLVDGTGRQPADLQ